MKLSRTSRWFALQLVASDSGQSLLELSVAMPLLILMLAYAIDFGYFFIVAADLTFAAGTAAEFSAQGALSAAQSSLPAAGPLSATNSVASQALDSLSGLTKASTLTTIQVCSKSVGVTNNVTNCNKYGTGSSTYTPASDPEAPRFVLQRIDITYTVQPPIPLSFFRVGLLPNMQFHRQVSMRALD